MVFEMRIVQRACSSVAVKEWRAQIEALKARFTAEAAKFFEVLY